MASGVVEKVELWRKSEGAKGRCQKCTHKSVVELAESGCSCGIRPMPTKAGNDTALRKHLAESVPKLEELNKRLEDLPSLERSETEMTVEDLNGRRDEWVAKNRKPGENEYATRARFWKTHPDLRDLSRSGLAEAVKRPEPTIGEKTTEAIDKRARAWHLAGLHGNENLPTLRGRIRKAVPGLVELERSNEPWLSFQKSDDEASRFVAEWS